MRGETFSALSALLDGELVRPEEVAQAIETAGARRFLLDSARLRWEVGKTTAPNAKWLELTWNRLGRRKGAWLATAGIAATLALASVLFVSLAIDTEGETIPEPDRVILLEYGRDWVG